MSSFVHVTRIRRESEREREREMLKHAEIVGNVEDNALGFAKRCILSP